VLCRPSTNQHSGTAAWSRFCRGGPSQIYEEWPAYESLVLMRAITDDLSDDRRVARAALRAAKKFGPGVDYCRQLSTTQLRHGIVGSRTAKSQKAVVGSKLDDRCGLSSRNCPPRSRLLDRKVIAVEMEAAALYNPLPV